MSELVQAWMDAEFGTTDVPKWREFYCAVIERYVPPDHDDRLERTFSKMRQRDTLLHYVEQWQVLDSALNFSEVHISNRRKVMSFVEGMKDREDKYKVLQEKPSTLKDVYTTVHNIRRVKVLTRDTKEDYPRRITGNTKGRRSSPQAKSRTQSDRQLHKLEGSAKQKAWADGNCLNCGEKGHFIANCPSLKNSIKSAVKKYAQFFNRDKEKTTKDLKKTKPQARKNPTKKLHQMTSQPEDQEEEDIPEDTSDLSPTDPEQESDESQDGPPEGEEGNSGSESEG
jgi:hypothetical protein